MTVVATPHPFGLTPGYLRSSLLSTSQATWSGARAHLQNGLFTTCLLEYGELHRPRQEDYNAPEPVVHNLPLQLTSFVGRERELAQVGRLLSTTRLLSLTGAGGVGKTRLAVEAAAGLIDRFKHGVCVVELEPVADEALVPQAVASALCVREDQRRPLLETVSRYLHRRELLLVLDNCEHLIGGCAALADHVLRNCPGVSILATSRQSLNTPGEMVWLVPSLSVPELPGGQSGTPAPQLSAQAEAVQLFVERAAAVSPDFALTPDNSEAVADVCRQMDGIPLAIEFAAARVKVLSVQQIRERLDNRFGLLSSGSRTAVPRHQTLRAMVDWSHDLLDPLEQRLLARMSVFAGGCTLEAVEGVCAAEDLHGPPTLNLLSGLVDKSLVLAERLDTRKRYRLLETLRQYAAGKLQEAGEEFELRDRHLAWFAELSAQAEAGLYGPDQASWFARLDLEIDNLRAALAWSKTSGSRVEPGLRLIAALWRFWCGHGYLTEGWDRLSELLAMEVPAGIAASPQFAAARASALNIGGRLAIDLMDLAAARSLLEEGLRIRQELGEVALIEYSLRHLGVLAVYEGNLAAGESLLRQALDLARELGDVQRASFCLSRAGQARRFQGDIDGAVGLWEEALEMSRTVHDAWHIALLQAWLGKFDLDRGDVGTAKVRLMESLRVYRQIGDSARVATALEGLGSLAAAEGKAERAVCLAGAVAACYELTDLRAPSAEHANQARQLAGARGSLSEEAAAAAWAEGQAMTVEQSIAYALSGEHESSAVVAPDSPTGPLTPREREVAALIVRGMTNRDIAASLVISEGTARVHVDHILSKLGFRSRAEVAAWAVRQGLDEPIYSGK